MVNREALKQACIRTNSLVPFPFKAQKGEDQVTSGQYSQDKFCLYLVSIDIEGPFKIPGHKNEVLLY